MDFDLRKGSDGGDSTLEAVCPVTFSAEAGAPSLLEKKKMKKPMHRMSARTKVMGFWRRNERGVGIGEVRGEADLGRLSQPSLYLEHQRRERGEVVGDGMADSLRGWVSCRKGRVMHHQN